MRSCIQCQLEKTTQETLLLIFHTINEVLHTSNSTYFGGTGDCKTRFLWVKEKGQLSCLTKPSTAWGQGCCQHQIWSLSRHQKPEPTHTIPHVVVHPAFDNFLSVLIGLSTVGLRGFDATFPFKVSFFAFEVQESLIKHSALLDTFVINYECEKSNILSSS